MYKESVLGGRAHGCDLRAVSLLDTGNHKLSRLPRSMETRTRERSMQRL